LIWFPAKDLSLEIADSELSKETNQGGQYSHDQK
jgi:hypothetical protein